MDQLRVHTNAPTMPPSSLNFITGNANKLAEVEAILSDVVPLKSRSLDLVEIQGSIEEISRDKCKRAADIVGIEFYLILWGFLGFMKI